MPSDLDPALAPRAPRARRALVLGAASALGGVVLAGRPGVAGSAPSAARVGRVLVFALELDRLEVAFYTAAQRTGRLRGELAEFARAVGAQEAEHVEALEQALGSAAGPPPRFDLADAVRDERTFTRSAIALEDALVAAYNGQVANLPRESLARIISIASVEARHSAWIRDIAGEPPAAEPVDEPRTADAVRTALRDRGLLP